MIVTNKDLLREFSEQPCELCGAGPPSDPHHVFCRGMGGGKRLDIRINLMSLCRKCHQKVQGDRAMLDELCRLVIQREVWRLLRAPKEQHYTEN